MSSPVQPPSATSTPPLESPARERARATAARHLTRHGSLPSVRQLQAIAEVSRETAADAFKTLREQSLFRQLGGGDWRGT